MLEEQLLGLEGLGDVVRPGGLGIQQVRDSKHLLGFGEALVGESLEMAREGGDQSFDFASFHLSNLTFIQHHAADQLNIE